MSAIDVTQAIPKRLFFSEDTWCLEVQRWQTLDRDVFNPIRSFIVGTAKVSAYLKETKNTPQILAQSRDILASPGASGASYEFSGSEWLLETEFIDYAPPDPSSMTDDLERMQKYISVLEKRLSQLEQRLTSQPGNDIGLNAHTFHHEEIPQSSTG